jgi:hypothetical protein
MAQAKDVAKFVRGHFSEVRKVFVEPTAGPAIVKHQITF